MKRKPTKHEALIGGLSLAVTIALCVAIIQYRSYLDQIAHYGYIGCFIINLVASATVVAPGLNILITFTFGGVLNPAIIAAVSGLGEAIGVVSAYLIGYSGKRLFQGNNSSLYTRFTNMLHRHGSKFVFAMASIINPIYYPFAIFLGMLRFGLIRFFLLTWAGRTIKDMALAYAGYFGLRFILQWLGLSI
jgi:membrane protein DedA with SNARE-associated domain